MNASLYAAQYWSSVSRQATAKNMKPQVPSKSTSTYKPEIRGYEGQKIGESRIEPRVSVDSSDLDRLLASWEALLQDYPGMKRELLEKLGTQLLADVRGKIGGSGTVQSWQGRYLGSKNGYVAIRPKADTYKVTSGGKRYAVGYVTNAIENGHKHRRPSQVKRAGYRYRARINVAAVPGKHFYASVRENLGSMGQQEIQALAAEIARRLEGGG